ncbi:alpha/beta fold hydrolase [Streptomyces gamaensis]|uniref:Alpha/beta fold hydrolase n=1 Tax=Streptomyces gamaensis TaxID=1763542 RepID=A0ABW0YZP7_9ACTN
MTTFVLIPGAHTGAWVWEAVAQRLREAGAGAEAVELTGVGDRGQYSESAVDLQTHVQDVVRAVDAIADGDVVLVGHCYGVHPMLAAAGLRPERVVRVVAVDTALPQDGVPALALVPDQEFRERLARGGDGPVAPPTAEEWPRWGSLDGVPEEAREQLARRAVPQPLRTFTQPLPLPPAAADVPVTGILCGGNGSSIALVENLLGLGEPGVQALTHPRFRFFELGTGHWPMLAAPKELADILLRAAAGEGRRLSPRREEPAHLRRFLLDVPERPRERKGRVDLYVPDADGPRPAIVFVHGGPVPAEARPTPRDWPTFVGYGQYVASQGLVGVTLDHRLHALTDHARAAEDIAAAVELVRADPRVDAERVALWFFSGGGLLSADWLAAPPPWLRCVAATYPVLAPLPGWGMAASRFRPAAVLGGAGKLPFVLIRVGQEMPEIAAMVEEFLQAAEDCDAAVEVIDVPEAHHGFETLDHTEETRAAVRHAVRVVGEHLRG